MTSFYEWDTEGTVSRLTTKSPEDPGTHSIDFRMMKGWVDHGATQWV